MVPFEAENPQISLEYWSNNFKILPDFNSYWYVLSLTANRTDNQLIRVFFAGIAIAGGDKLGFLIDLIGAVLLSLLGLFVPACLDIIVDWDEGWGMFHWRLIKNLLIMILSLFGLVSGVYYAIREDL